MPIPPLVLAMVVCDAFYRDRVTGKFTILGTFSVLRANGFPFPMPYIGVYLALSGASGRVSIGVRVIDVDEDEEPLARTEVETDFPDRRDAVEVPVYLEEILFPAAGEYRVQFYADGQFVSERRVLVVQE